MASGVKCNCPQCGALDTMCPAARELDEAQEDARRQHETVTLLMGRVENVTTERDEARAAYDQLREDQQRERDEMDQLAMLCGAFEDERDRLRALLQQLQWDKAGYCPLCFPGEAPYRHTDDCPLGRALEGRDG